MWKSPLKHWFNRVLRHILDSNYSQSNAESKFLRKNLLRALRAEFERKFKSDLPQFARVPGQYVPSGSDLYRWELAKDLFFFVFMQVGKNAYEERFMVEIGWNRSREKQGHMVFSDPASVDPEIDGVIRLPQFYKEKWASRSQPWWNFGNQPLMAPTLSWQEFQAQMDIFLSEEESAKRVAIVPQLVDDSVHKIREHAIPQFRKVAMQRGKPWLDKN